MKKIVFISIILTLIIVPSYSQSKNNFDSFILNFTLTSLPLSFDPYTLDINDIQPKDKYKKINQNLYKEIIQNIQGLLDTIPEYMESGDYYAIGKIVYKDFYITLLYYSGSAGGCQENYYLSVFDKKGRHISSKLVAAEACEGEHIYAHECKIKKDLRINIIEKVYLATYSDYKLKKTKKEFYIINNDGVITKQKKR